MQTDRPHEPHSRGNRLAAMLLGGSSPANMALAVTLGLAIGFTAGWNFTVLALLMLAALGNANNKLLAATALASSLLAWLAAPVTSSIGALVFDETPFGSWLGRLGDGPIVAMFDLDRYCLVGGLVLAFLLAGPLGRAAWQVGQSRLVDEELPPARRHEGLLRPWAWLALSMVLLLAGALPWWIGTRHLESRILALLSDFNGAEVSAARIHLDPWSGHLELDALQIPDPANLERDRLRIAHVRARLRGGPLLRGRLDIEHLHLTGIDRDVARHKAATAVATRIPQIRFSPAPLALPADPSQELELHDYIHGWDQFAPRLSLLGQLLGTLERIRSFEPDRLERASSATLFGPAARSNLGRPQPALCIDQTRAEDFGENWGMGHKALIDLTQLSTNPKLVKSPPSLKIVLPEFSAEVQSTLDFLNPGQRHRVQLQAFDLPLMSLVEQSSGGSRIAVEGGRVTISGQGWMDDCRFDLALQIQITALKARMQGSEPAAGITPAAWNQGLQDLGGLRAELTCGGRWALPRLHVQGRDLVNQFKHQLRSAGDHNLLALIEAQLAASPVPTAAAVVVSDSGPSPVELPHPLPTSDSPTAGLPAAPTCQGMEPLPQPTPAPAAMQEPGPGAATPIEPLPGVATSAAASIAAQVVGNNPVPLLPASAPPPAIAAGQGAATKVEPARAKPAEPLTPPAVASDQATPLEQPLQQPRDVLAETTPTVAANASRTKPANAHPAPSSSGVVTVSDELFGPPPLAVGRDLVTPNSAVAPVWQPRVDSSPPSYSPPRAPVVSYTPPTPPALQSYSPPPAAAKPVSPSYSPPQIAVPTTTPTATLSARRPMNTTIAPPAAEIPPSGPVAISPPPTSYRTSPSTSEEMPGPINLQLGRDAEAQSVSSQPASTSVIAAKRNRPNKPSVPTPQQLAAESSSAAPTFFRQPTQPIAKQPPMATATDAPKSDDDGTADSSAAPKPWYKRLW